VKAYLKVRRRPSELSFPEQKSCVMGTIRTCQQLAYQFGSSWRIDAGAHQEQVGVVPQFHHLLLQIRHSIPHWLA